MWCAGGVPRRRPGAVGADRDPIDDLAGSLREHGLAVCDGFLSAWLVHALSECAVARRARGDFADARIGAGRALQRRADIRGDSICWLEEPLFPAERELLALFEEARRGLNQSLFLGLYDVELHYAWYPPGAGYSRHIDQPQGRAARRLSSIVYLNETWQASDGGELRCFTDGRVLRQFEPIGGRLVLFLTEDREHEVLPTARERLSITGWFLGRQEHALR
jgi:SM-20-related protein